MQNKYRAFVKLNKHYLVSLKLKQSAIAGLGIAKINKFCFAVLNAFKHLENT